MNRDLIQSAKTAVIYTRVSSGDQAEKGISLQNQLTEGNKKAKALGAEVLRVFTDEAVSGRTEDRPAFQEAMDYCELMLPDYLILWSTSRFMRNKLQAAIYKARLEKAGVKWVYVTVDLSGDDDATWMAEGMMELFDELTSRTISKDTKASLIHNAKAGNRNGGKVPFGYMSVPSELDANRKRLVPDPSEVPFVHMVFDLKHREKKGARQIAAYMNTHGHEYRGKKWAKSTIHAMLKNTVYIGQSVFNKVNRATRVERPRDEWVIVDSHEAIIDQEQWYAVQEDIYEQAESSAPGARRSPCVLSNILKCDECGLPMSVESGKGRSKTYHYYVCMAARHQNKHDVRRLPADKLDAWLLDAICNEVFTEATLGGIIQEVKKHASTWETSAKRDRAVLSRKVTEINKRINNLFEILEKHGVDAPNLGDMSERIQQLKKERGAIERELIKIDESQAPKLVATIDDVSIMQGFLKDIVLSSKPEKARKFLKTFIDSVVVAESGVDITYDAGQLVKTTGAVRLTSNWLLELGSNQRPND